MIERTVFYCIKISCKNYDKWGKINLSKNVKEDEKMFIRIRAKFPEIEHINQPEVFPPAPPEAEPFEPPMHPERPNIKE